jgi:hypothetical protein
MPLLVGGGEGVGRCARAGACVTGGVMDTVGTVEACATACCPAAYLNLGSADMAVMRSERFSSDTRVVTRAMSRTCALVNSFLTSL